MKRTTFDKDFKKYLSWFVCIVIVICFFPLIFTLRGCTDFTNTGQIGDTIGGIMGPFVAIAAAFLTFMAFWVQFKANIEQRADIAKERFEGKFYKMLDIHLQNVSTIQDRNAGQSVFKELYGTLKQIYHTVNNAYIKERQYIMTSGLKPQDNEYVAFIHALDKDELLKQKIICMLAYGYFFYGIDFCVWKKKDTCLYQLNLNLSVRLKTDYIGLLSLFTNRNEEFGRYFRHLYQTVSYVANGDSRLISENEKYDYVKLLRTQMSDYEQVLLYYNSLSDAGCAWNKENDASTDDYRVKMGYIARFKLIKNIPQIEYFGINPSVFYQKEIKLWAEHDESFFEQAK